MASAIQLITEVLTPFHGFQNRYILLSFTSVSNLSFDDGYLRGIGGRHKLLPVMSSSTSEVPQVIQTYGGQPTFSCINCAATISLQDELISKSFSGRDGRGYLMHSAVNVKMGRREERPLLTGVHTVADVFCVGCNDRLGWYYHHASDYAQKYKEGKFLLERERLVKENAWKLDR